jgi:tripartite-type tricarboxylate transporter receptor subunit TctC
MVVNPSLPVRSVPEFIAYARANPGKLNMASAGNGTPQHVYGELFKLQTGVNMQHVPNRSAAGITDLVTGQSHVSFEPMSTSVQYMQSGNVRGLAVSSASRWPGLPDLPTIGEFVPGFEFSLFSGIGAPRGTPRDVVEKLNREINLSLDDPKIKASITGTGRMGLKGSQEAFARLVASEIEKSAKAIKAANIKAE